MELTKKYKDINDTMRHLKMQIVDSIPYAKTLPEMRTPEQCFWYLKKHTRYKHDPPGVELLQSMQTLMEGKYWGVPAGDCDCMTISICALLIANNFDNFNIVLVGRNKKTPVHIYVVIYEDGERKVLDLTNRKPGVERPYPYTQELPVNWRKW